MGPVVYRGVACLARLALTRLLGVLGPSPSAKNWAELSAFCPVLGTWAPRRIVEEVDRRVSSTRARRSGLPCASGQFVCPGAQVFIPRVTRVGPVASSARVAVDGSTPNSLRSRCAQRWYARTASALLF